MTANTGITEAGPRARLDEAASSGHGTRHGARGHGLDVTPVIAVVAGGGDGVQYVKATIRPSIPLVRGRP